MCTHLCVHLHTNAHKYTDITHMQYTQTEIKGERRGDRERRGSIGEGRERGEGRVEGEERGREGKGGQDRTGKRGIL